MAGFHLRKNQRFNEVMPVRYRREGTVCEGLLNELALSGCSITGTVPVSVGMVLRVQLRVPGDPEPFLIERAMVKWVKRLEFGVEFEQLPAMAHARLQHLIFTLARDQRDMRAFAYRR
jgi:PilZ domain-containing protein